MIKYCYNCKTLPSKHDVESLCSPSKENKTGVAEIKIDCDCSQPNPQTIGEIMSRFDNFMFDEYGKWKIGRKEAKDFITHALHAYEEATKVNDRVFELREDNPQYSLGQTNGWWLCRGEIDKRRKAFWGE